MVQCADGYCKGREFESYLMAHREKTIGEEGKGNFRRKINFPEKFGALCLVSANLEIEYATQQ